MLSVNLSEIYDNGKTFSFYYIAEKKDESFTAYIFHFHI